MGLSAEAASSLRLLGTPGVQYSRIYLARIIKVRLRVRVSAVADVRVRVSAVADVDDVALRNLRWLGFTRTISRRIPPGHTRLHFVHYADTDIL